MEPKKIFSAAKNLLKYLTIFSSLNCHMSVTLKCQYFLHNFRKISPVLSTPRNVEKIQMSAIMTSCLGLGPSFIVTDFMAFLFCSSVSFDNSASERLLSSLLVGVLDDWNIAADRGIIIENMLSACFGTLRDLSSARLLARNKCLVKKSIIIKETVFWYNFDSQNLYK